MERTLVMIKPNGVKDRLIGEVISRFEKARLSVIRLEMKEMTRSQVRAFYKEHERKYFYKGLIKFMTSGPIVVMVVQGKKAISAVRAIAGATNPKDALPGTIRFDFAPNTTMNVLHASDSKKSAKREIKFHFGQVVL
jgi:nucleoside-diphosphate kinase